MSHEIRTPINSILGFTDLIEESVKDQIKPEEQTFFNIIRSSSERLMNTVHGILDMSQIEVGTLAVDIKELDLIKMDK